MKSSDWSYWIGIGHRAWSYGCNQNCGLRARVCCWGDCSCRSLPVGLLRRSIRIANTTSRSSHWNPSPPTRWLSAKKISVTLFFSQSFIIFWTDPIKLRLVGNQFVLTQMLLCVILLLLFDSSFLLKAIWCTKSLPWQLLRHPCSVIWTNLQDYSSLADDVHQFL